MGLVRLAGMPGRRNRGAVPCLVSAVERCRDAHRCGAVRLIIRGSGGIDAGALPVAVGVTGGDKPLDRRAAALYRDYAAYLGKRL